MSEKNIVGPLQIVGVQKDVRTTPAVLNGKPIRVRSIKHARRLMGRLILEFQKGLIDGREAKDLAYLLSVFIQTVKDEELEQRISSLEDKING